MMFDQTFWFGMESKLQGETACNKHAKQTYQWIYHIYCQVISLPCDGNYSDNIVHQNCPDTVMNCNKEHLTKSLSAAVWFISFSFSKAGLTLSFSLVSVHDSLSSSCGEISFCSLERKEKKGVLFYCQESVDMCYIQGYISMRWRNTKDNIMLDTPPTPPLWCRFLLPNPFRNLLTPLCSVSGNSSKYCSTLCSNRPAQHRDTE